MRTEGVLGKSVGCRVSVCSGCTEGVQALFLSHCHRNQTERQAQRAQRSPSGVCEQISAISTQGSGAGLIQAGVKQVPANKNEDEV